MLEKKKDSAISSQALQKQGRFRDYNRNYQIIRLGKWYSPFLLETEGIKEAAGPRAIRGGATPQNEKSKDFSSRWHEMKIMR